MACSRAYTCAQRSCTCFRPSVKVTVSHQSVCLLRFQLVDGGSCCEEHHGTKNPGNQEHCFMFFSVHGCPGQCFVVVAPVQMCKMSRLGLSQNREPPEWLVSSWFPLKTTPTREPTHKHTLIWVPEMVGAGKPKDTDLFGSQSKAQRGHPQSFQIR